MNLTCSQMDVLISFYIEGDLSINLKKQVEEHMKNCATCRAKYDIIKSMIEDIKLSISENKNINTNNDINLQTKIFSPQYKIFKNNLSAYIDNELSSDENIKIKKFTINNTLARQELQDNYNIRRLMNTSFKKTETETKHDFSRNIIKQLELEDELNLDIHPVIKILLCFTILVLVVTSFILISLSI